MSEKTTVTPQQNDLKTIGSILRKKREEHGYTLEHVSEITRITLTSLRNIENGNLDALPGLVFVRGFIRNYAKLLGIESDWMTEALSQAYSTRTHAQPTQEQTASMTSLDEPPASKTKPYIIAGVLVIVGLVAFLLYWQSRPLNNQYAGLNKKVETVQAIDNKAPEPDKVQNVIEPEIKKSVKKPEPVKQEISPLTLTVQAMSNDWIRLKIDDQEPFDLRLKDREKYDWPAKEEYSLIMTTGGSARIYLNGEEIVDRENHIDQLYQAKLNKFTLTRMNNR